MVIITVIYKANIHTEIKHITCGNIYKVVPSKFVQGRRCPECSRKQQGGKISKTHEQFVEDVFDTVENEYTVAGTYIDSLTKIKMIHNKCGHEWKITPGNFLSGKRCPKCKETKGEKAISDWLDKNNISYEIQYKFKECKDERSLPFDFAVFQNNKLVLLIEYDGQHHFQPVRYGKNDKNSENRYIKNKKHDRIKNTYCKENNIALLRIPYYYLHDIKLILDREVIGY